MPMVDKSRHREWEKIFPGLNIDAFNPCKKLKNAIIYDGMAPQSAQTVLSPSLRKLKMKLRPGRAFLNQKGDKLWRDHVATQVMPWLET